MNNSVRFAFFGVLFGVGFPVIATIVESVKMTQGMSLLDLHLHNPLLLIIDTAPVFLGLFSFIGGRYADKKVQVEKMALAIVAEKERRQSEGAALLEQQNVELHELNKTLDGLVYTASHDLKTPVINLKSMITMLKTIRERPGSEAMVADVINRMELAVDRFQVTISDLLDISRIERQEHMANETIDIAEMLQVLWASADNMVKAKAATLIIEVDEFPKIQSVRQAFESIFLNLLTNSLKYSHPERPPEIKVHASRKGNKVEFQIADNGLGIDTEVHKDKLFRMFSRFHTGVEGSGIGLYIIKRTIQKLGGEIRLESTVGSGTKFFILLPIDDQNEKA